MKRLDGKVCVITGGGSGIGLATAKLFAANGAKQVLFGRDENKLESAAKEIDGPVHVIAGDVCKVTDLARLFAETHDKFGKIDSIFVNAGIGPNVPFEQVTEEHFVKMFQINVQGALFTVQKALGHLNKGASIVLMSSGAAYVGFPNISVYAASKAAVRSLARTLSGELLPQGVRVNSLSPGLTDSPALSPEAMGVPPEVAQGFAQMVAQKVPIGRLGTVDEIAAAALFLACDDSSFCVGMDLVVDGGLTHL